MLNVAFDELDIGIVTAPQRHELWAEVEADDVAALLMQQIGENARPAAKIDDARATREAAKPDDGLDQPGVALWRKDVIGVRRGMVIEEFDLFSLVLPSFEARCCG